jgi:Sigma-70, region 4/Sigma-70 region 3
VPTILGEIKRHFRDRTWAVHVPRDLQELSLRVDRAVGELAEGLHRQSSVAEIAAAVGVDDEDVLEALQAGGAYRARSFDAPVGGADEDVVTLGEWIGVDEHGFDRAEDRATLAALLAMVTPREREVLRRRFEQDMTQSEIGAVIGGQPDASLADHPPRTRAHTPRHGLRALRLTDPRVQAVHLTPSAGVAGHSTPTLIHARLALSRTIVDRSAAR